MRLAVVASLAFVALTTACGPSGANATAPNTREVSPAAFAAAEDEILRELSAVDPRLAQRAHITPSEEDRHRVTMAAVLREDSTLAVVDGAVDPFSFDARMRGLETARAKVLSLPRAEGRLAERELLSRLVDAERCRLEEERALPRSASALIRAIVDTWRIPASKEEAAELDRWLSGRLRTLREAVTATTEPARDLDVVRARELDDALDALERLASAPGFTVATQELVRVREAVESVATKPAATAHSEWNLVGTRTRVHLGLDEAPEATARRLAALEADLRTRVDKALSTKGVSPEAVASSIDGHLLASGACLDAVPGSRVRSMAAPQEREPSCHLRHFVARAEGDVGEIAALTLMHDHVVVAQWALDVARGASTLAEVESRYRLLTPASPAARARYERVALARPVAALGAAEAVAILSSPGSAAPKTVAINWTSLGDVPFDVARSELAVR